MEMLLTGKVTIQYTFTDTLTEELWDLMNWEEQIISNQKHLLTELLKQVRSLSSLSHKKKILISI
jgi:hypothetical protein